MFESVQLYQSRVEDYKTPYGAVSAGECVRISIFPRRSEAVTQAMFLLAADGEPPKAYPMRWDGLFGDRDRYTITFPAGDPALYWYSFTICSRRGLRFINCGSGGVGVESASEGTRFQLTVYDGTYQVASWFGKGITYNIFPDRFARAAVADIAGRKRACRVHENWDDIPEYRPDEHGEILNNDFFGGNLRGVIEKLDYLESLHVRTLYFNPMFEAFSNHRYDTADYKHIDPFLGCEADFRELCAQAKKRGMRVILDGVFSHTGYDSVYFNARGHYDSVGAHQSKDSPYYEWYDFSRWPDEYSSWWGIYTLPQVNEMNAKYLGYIIENTDSVIRHWLDAGASGWRLDVADELPDAFIERLSRAAREQKPDALIVGEVWEDASNKISYDVRRRYFQGGELDSVMNYPLRDGVLAFLAGSPAEQLAERMETLRENYPREVFYNLMNIIGTHDTPRVLTVLGVDDTVWRESRDWRAQFRLEGEALTLAKRRLRMAAVLQFTMPGSPTIYYGDEAGLQGFEDPFNRRTYPWGHEDTEILEFYRRLCTVRDVEQTLRTGELRFLEAAGDLLIYVRETASDRLLIAVNRGDKPLSRDYECAAADDLLNGQRYEQPGGVTLHFAPVSAGIYRMIDGREA